MINTKTNFHKIRELHFDIWLVVVHFLSQKLNLKKIHFTPIPLGYVCGTHNLHEKMCHSIVRFLDFQQLMLAIYRKNVCLSIWKYKSNKSGFLYSVFFLLVVLSGPILNSSKHCRREIFQMTRENDTSATTSTCDKATL